MAEPLASASLGGLALGSSAAGQMHANDLPQPAQASPALHAYAPLLAPSAPCSSCRRRELDRESELPFRDLWTDIHDVDGFVRTELMHIMDTKLPNLHLAMPSRKDLLTSFGRMRECQLVSKL